MSLRVLTRSGRRAGRAFAGGDSGVALIEFALTAVIFLMTILGTLEFGIAVWRYNMVSDLAQEGARWASVRGLRGSSQATAGDVQTFVTSRATGIVLAGVDVTSPSSVTGACTATAVDPSTLVSGAGICVTVRAVYVPLAGLIPQATMNLSSTAKMVMAR